MASIAMLSHVALLVPSVKGCADKLAQYGYELGDISEFPTEGTREIYVGPPDASGSLLLMEAIGPGAYDRAKRKRGFGLHHVAIDVENPKSFCVAMGGAGWLLHPRSLEFLHKNVLYLVRPGVGAAIEVQQLREGTAPGRAFVTRIKIRCESGVIRLPDALSVPGLCGCNGATAIWIEDKTFPIDLLTT
jgi:catechol 2,3-dioxygenase-like lactoylglutathione lyase family enzyme